MSIVNLPPLLKTIYTVQTCQCLDFCWNHFLQVFPSDIDFAEGSPEEASTDIQATQVNFFREKFQKNKFWVSANILFIVFLFWNLSLPEFYVGEHLKCGFLGCGWLVQPNAKSIEEPKQDTLWGPWHWLLVPFFDNQWWNSHQSLVKMWEAFFKLNYPLLSTFPEKRIFSGQTMWLKGSLHRL